MMRNDFRRFAYGLTIEDFTVRVWLCDRSENMVSQPFELDKVSGSVFRDIDDVLTAICFVGTEAARSSLSRLVVCDTVGTWI